MKPKGYTLQEPVASKALSSQSAWSEKIAVPHMVQVSIAGTRLEMHAIDYEGRLFDQMIIDKSNRPMVM